MTATTPQITTTGGMLTPRVVPIADDKLVNDVGGMAEMLPLVQTRMAPWTTAYMPSVMISGLAPKRWQRNPLRPPSSPHTMMMATTIVAMDQ